MSMIRPPGVAGRWQPLIIVASVGGAAAAAGWMAWSAWRTADLRAQARSAAVGADWDRPRRSWIVWPGIVRTIATS